MSRCLSTLLLILLVVSCNEGKQTGNSQGTDTHKTNQGTTTAQVKRMNTKQFWTLINKAVEASLGDDSNKTAYLTSELSKLSEQEIRDFEMVFRQCVIDADEFKIMAAQKIISGYVSDDSYLYFRCWLIGQGQVVFSETLKDPDYLVNLVEADHFYEWEDLLYISDAAYALKTGKKENESFPRNYALSHGLDYDFGAPPTKGKDWTEEELPKLLPKLWAKCHFTQ